MFSKKKKQRKAEEAKGKVETIIGNGTVTGDLFTKGSLRVEGKIKGAIKAEGDLYVGANGVINAEVEARNVVIAGTVNGDVIAAEKLEILKTGKLNGNIKTKTIKIEAGASFVGVSKPFNTKNNTDVSSKVNKELKNGKKEVAAAKEKN